VKVQLGARNNDASLFSIFV